MDHCYLLDVKYVFLCVFNSVTPSLKGILKTFLYNKIQICLI